MVHPLRIKIHTARERPGRSGKAGKGGDSATRAGGEGSMVPQRVRWDQRRVPTLRETAGTTNDSGMSYTFGGTEHRLEGNERWPAGGDARDYGDLHRVPFTTLATQTPRFWHDAVGTAPWRAPPSSTPTSPLPLFHSEGLRAGSRPDRPRIRPGGRNTCGTPLECC
jgi:hypothetical protein